MTTDIDPGPPIAAPHSIRIICYWGDYDDLHDIIVVGPYPDRATRDRDLNRLASLPGAYGSAGFEASRLPTQGADLSATPGEVAEVADFDALVDAITHVEGF